MKQESKIKTYNSKIVRRLLTVFLWLLLTIISFYMIYFNSIANIGFSPKQNIEFSHKLHSKEYGFKCLSCHYSAETEFHSVVPSVSSCMTCHIALKTETELIKPLIDAFDDEKPIFWQKVYRLPDFARFDHASHIKVGIDCSSCHGKVEEFDNVRQVRKLNMKWCLDCHRNPEENIIFAREISGIFTFGLDSDNSFESNSMTKPFFGAYKPKVVSPFFSGAFMPRNAVKGPTYCSACHY